MIGTTPISKPPPVMRLAHLRRLFAPQELYVERLVAGGAVHRIDVGGVACGYAITGPGGRIVEIHIEDFALAHAPRVLDALAETLGARSLLAQSFDSLAMFLGLTRESRVVSLARLYRIILDGNFTPRADIRARPGAPGDIAELAVLSDDFFDDEAEIAAYQAAQGLIVYRRGDGELIGAGVFETVIAGMDGVDIGMVVSPRHRGRGYGVHIVRHLKAHCLDRGWRPICGCAIDNLASQRTIERAGFASLHTLVEFAL
jgi:RimJ/RimL family protein N-acetyltransferase